MPLEVDNFYGGSTRMPPVRDTTNDYVVKPLYVESRQKERKITTCISGLVKKIREHFN